MLQTLNNIFHTAYGCSFVTKLSWKSFFKKKKTIMFFRKIHVICRKKYFYSKKQKSFIQNNLAQKTYVKVCLIWEIGFYTENVSGAN